MSKYEIIKHMGMISLRDVSVKARVNEFTMRKILKEPYRLSLESAQYFMNTDNLPHAYYKQRDVLREILKLYPTDRYLRTMIEEVLCL